MEHYPAKARSVFAGQRQFKEFMPELPEVETIRLQLDKALTGLKIVGIEVLNKKSFIGEIEEVKGLRVLGVKRRAKITIIELEGGVYLAIHLKLTGQLIYRGKGEKVSQGKMEQKKGPFEVDGLPNKFTRVIISFDNGGKLYFNDLRMFGWIKVIKSSKLKVQSDSLQLKAEDEIPELRKLGPEANDPEAFSLEYFRKILEKTGKPIKLVIMDQEKLAGVGNIYANEALFAARIMPTRKANSLTAEEVGRLREAIINVLNEAIKYKGTSDEDEAYRQITGEKGNFQKFLKVYGKEGQKCPKCGGIIKRVSLGGRGTFFCEQCQR